MGVNTLAMQSAEPEKIDLGLGPLSELNTVTGDSDTQEAATGFSSLLNKDLAEMQKETQSQSSTEETGSDPAIGIVPIVLPNELMETSESEVLGLSLVSSEDTKPVSEVMELETIDAIGVDIRGPAATAIEEGQSPPNPSLISQRLSANRRSDLASTSPAKLEVLEEPPQPDSPSMLKEGVLTALTSADPNLHEMTSRLVAARQPAPEHLPATLLDAAASGEGAVFSTGPSTGRATSLPTAQVTEVQLPLNDAKWEQAFGNRIRWLAGNNIQSASIRLNPADLGPVNVELSVADDQARVNFLSHHAIVREAIEAALPRLRDIFTNSGIDLVDVNISERGLAQQDPRYGSGDAKGDDTSHRSDTTPDETLPTDTALGTIGSQDGLIDTFV